MLHLHPPRWPASRGSVCEEGPQAEGSSQPALPSLGMSKPEMDFHAQVDADCRVVLGRDALENVYAPVTRGLVATPESVVWRDGTCWTVCRIEDVANAG